MRDPDQHVETVEKVAQCARSNGLDIYAVQASPLPGPAGNVEYFLAMRSGHPDAILEQNLHNRIVRAVQEGPAVKGRKHS